MKYRFLALFMLVGSVLIAQPQTNCDTLTNLSLRVDSPSFTPLSAESFVRNYDNIYVSLATAHAKNPTENIFRKLCDCWLSYPIAKEMIDKEHEGYRKEADGRFVNIEDEKIKIAAESNLEAAKDLDSSSARKIMEKIERSTKIKERELIEEELKEKEDKIIRDTSSIDIISSKNDEVVIESKKPTLKLYVKDTDLNELLNDYAKLDKKEVVTKHYKTSNRLGGYSFLYIAKQMGITSVTKNDKKSDIVSAIYNILNPR